MSHPAPVYLPPLSDTARLLGNLGLVPFVLGAALVWVVKFEVHAFVTLALSAYAGIITATQAISDGTTPQMNSVAGGALCRNASPQ